MGKKFIDKKKSVSYRLVPTESGPAQFESNVPKHTFVPISKETDKHVGLGLQDKVFATAPPIETERIFPSTGPRPDWDPDIVAALDDDFDYKDPENILDDEFVSKANAPNLTAILNDFDDDEDDNNSNISDMSGNFFDGDEEEVNSDIFAQLKNQRRAKTTQYSMTSATSNCTEDVKLMNEKFEKLMEVYDDCEIGAVEVEETNLEPSVAENRSCEILHSKHDDDGKFVLDNCDDDMKQQILNYAANETEKFITVYEEEKNSDDDEDCLSYAESHVDRSYQPTLIQLRNETSKTSRSRARKKSTEEHAEELDSVSDSKSDLSLHHRPKSETAEERRERKQKVKAVRKESREIKKQCKLAYKSEKIRQTVSQSTNSINPVAMKL